MIFQITKAFFLAIVVSNCFILKSMASIKKGTHFQKYYGNLFIQKNNLSDMYLFGEISASKYHYQLWEKNQLHIGIFLGNDDQNGEFNILKKKSMLQIFSEECFEGIYACEFKIVNSNRLQKNNTTISFFTSNSINSKKMKNIFNHSLQDFDVVLYLGHSRNGGGPDFNNPVYLKGSSKHNWSYYLKKKEGVRLLESTIKGVVSNKLIGIFSCKSEKYFYNTLEKNNNIDLVLTGELIKSSSMDKVLFTFLNFFLGKGKIGLDDSILSTMSHKQLLRQILSSEQ